MTTANTTAIEFRILDKKLTDSETVLISMKELNVDPSFQMREKMDHENITLYAESLEDLPPVRVFEVGNRLILTDGFHRFFAHELVGAEDIKAKVIEGTQFEAMAYAMAANFVHLKGGSKPSSSDQKKAIERMCGLLSSKFDYDSKEVVPTLQSYGITCTKRWANKCTETVRAGIDAKRDAAILEHVAEGKSQREVAEAVGCSKGTVQNAVAASGQNGNCSDSVQPEESPAVEESTEELPWEDEGFSDEELESAPPINPADAYKKTLDDFDETLQQETADTTIPSTVAPIVPTDGNVTTSEDQLIDLLNQLRAIRNSDSYQDQLTALKEDDSDYASTLMNEALLFADDLEA